MTRLSLHFLLVASNTFLALCRDCVADAPPPPDIALIRVTKVVMVPVRLEMMAYVIDQKRPSEFTFEIDSYWPERKTFFLKAGDDIPNTHFKIQSFRKNEDTDKDGRKLDVSEVALFDKEKEVIRAVLPLLRTGRDIYAIFTYKGSLPNWKHRPDFSRRPGQKFTFPPGSDVTYKVISIDEKNVIVECPDGNRRTFPVPR